MSSLLTTFAADVCKCIDTNMFGRVCSTGSGNEIYYVLNIVINVLTAGIGILAVIGIAYFGVQYLTAKDDPAQVKKAKSRLMAIIIGLAAYATIYAGLYFLLPNFTAKSGSFDTCTEASQGDPHQVSPSKPDTPDTPDTPHDDDDDDDHDDDHDDDVGERSPFCGPEAPGQFGTLSDVTNKQYRDGSTVSDRTTRKYTTTFGRVYYVFKQSNPVWKNMRAGSQGDNLGNNGCLRTSTATILRSFGANVTPADFAWAGGYSFTKADKYIKDNNLPVKRYELKKPYADKIWEVLNKHGAVIIWTEKESVFTSGHHKLPIVDYRIHNGTRQVYIADTTPKANNNGWKDLNDYVVKKGNVVAAVAFEPTTTLNCDATGGGTTQEDEQETVEKGSTCGPESPNTAGVYGSPSSINTSKDGSLTKKYTTTKNRVYYIFRQNDSLWKDKPAGSDTMGNEGESRTLIATIMRSFGAKVTPAYFSGGNDTGKKWALDRASNLISTLSLPLSKIEKITSDYKNKIMETMRNGGAVLLKVKKGIFKSSGTTHVAIIDWKLQNNTTYVFLIDPLGKTSAPGNSAVKINGWTDIDGVLDKSAGVEEAHLFKYNSTSCPAASSKPGLPQGMGPADLLY